MKPILKYPGAKWKISDWIIQNLPPHESYLEPFFGSGAVFFNKKPARIETINDIDNAVTRFFRTCRNHPDELARAIEMTPWARDEFEEASPRKEGLDDIEAARRKARDIEKLAPQHRGEGKRRPRQSQTMEPSSYARLRSRKASKGGPNREPASRRRHLRAQRARSTHIRRPPISSQHKNASWRPI